MEKPFAIASSYLCYNTPLGTTAETGLDARDATSGSRHRPTESSTALRNPSLVPRLICATQQRPTSEE